MERKDGKKESKKRLRESVYLIRVQQMYFHLLILERLFSHHNGPFGGWGGGVYDNFSAGMVFTMKNSLGGGVCFIR